MDSKFVWAAYGNILRFGRITKSKDDKGWRFHKITWSEDEAYEQHTETLHQLRPGRNYEKEWYRTDEVHYFDPKTALKRILYI
jgi:hypothetical protein